MWTSNSKFLISIILLILGVQILQTNAQQQCSMQSDIVFVMDQSGSIEDANPRNGSWDNWQLIQNFIIQIMTYTGVSYDGTHYGLVTFGNIGVPRFYLLDNLNLPALTAAVKRIPPGQGQTNLYEGLLIACQTILSVANNARPDVPQIIIIITDGFANINTDLTLPMAQSCQAAGIKIFAIGVTGLIDENQLKSVSSPPHEKGKNYWTAPDFTQLSSVVESVQQATCNPPKQIFDDCKTIDVCFAIDIPQAATDFVLAKSFINRFITLYLQIGADQVRVCIITFNDRQANLVIPLNRYYNETALKAAIDAIPFVASNNGDPTYALQTAMNSAFTPSNGARGANFKPTIVTMMNNPIYNRQSAIDAFNQLHAKGIRSIALGMTLDATSTDLSLITYIQNDVITSISYSVLSSQIQPLSGVLCGNTNYVVCPMKADICLAIDESTSIVAPPGNYNNWNTYMLGFAKSLASAFPISPTDTRIGTLLFSSAVYVQFQLSQYTNKNDLLNAIGNLNIAGGQTNIAGALRSCRTDILAKARPDVPHIVMLVTDGVANVEAIQTQYEANLTKASGATIFTVGVTSQIDTKQLSQVATFPPETHFFYASDFSKLNTILADLIQKSCNTVSTVSPPSSTSSTSRTTVTTTSQSTTTSTSIATPPSTTSSRAVTGSTSTTVTPPSSTSRSTLTPQNTFFDGGDCSGPMDIVLILDQSTSIVYAPGSYDNWYKSILGFASSIARSFIIGPANVQIGVVKFSDLISTAFYLNKYTDQASLVSAIMALSIDGGETNIAAALRMTRTALFNPANGARAGATKVVYLVTDGVPNRETNFTNPEDDLLKATGAVIFSIGVTSMTDPAVLRRLCTQPPEKFYIQVTDYSKLPGITSDLVGRTCQTSTPAVIPTTTTTTPRPATTTTTTPPPQPPTTTTTPPPPPATTTTTTTVAPTSSSTTSSSISSSSSTTTTTAAATTTTTTTAAVTTRTTTKSTISTTPTAVSTTSSTTLSTSSVRPATSSSTAAPPPSTSSTTPSPAVSSTTTTAATPFSTTTTSAPTTPGGNCSTSAVVDIVLILDQSTSIVYAPGSYDNWYKHILGFGSDLAQGYTIGPNNVQIGVVKFSDTSATAFYLNAYKDKTSLSNAILALNIDGGETDIAAALRLTRTVMFSQANGARPGVSKVVYLVTDGVPNRETNMTYPEDDMLKATGAQIYSIGITTMTNPTVLQRLCTQPSSNYYYYVSDYSQLRSIAGNLVGRTCSQLPQGSTVPAPATTTTNIAPTTTTANLVPTTTTTNIAPTSTTTLNNPVSVSATTTAASSTTTTTPGAPGTSRATIAPLSEGPTSSSTVASTSLSTAAPASRISLPSVSTTNPPTVHDVTGCQAVADIALILDESTSIVFAEGSYANWNQHILGFAESLVRSFAIAPDKTEISVMKFSENYTLAFGLNAYKDADSLVKAIRLLDINGGETNLALPMRIARTAVFPQGRSSAKKAIVLLTDGMANREVNMTIVEANLCKQNGIEIFTVGVTNETSPIQLQSIASLPVSSHYYYSSRFDQLADVVVPLAKNMCQLLLAPV